MATLKNKSLLQKIKALDSFRLHLWIYITVNAFLWLPWLINGNVSIYGIPAYIGLAWGVVLVIHYMVVASKFRKKE